MLKYKLNRLVEYGNQGRRQEKVTATCHCGNEFVAWLFSIKSGHTSSCGCGNHGLTDTPEYRSWVAMKKRCTNKNYQHYNEYGGRGISYDANWDGFLEFLADMGNRPDGTSLDRVDVNGNYNKENCRWVSQTEQCRNKRNSILLTLNGEEKHIKQWCEELGLNYGTVWMRLRRGWDIERALS
jgi:hypothetical protein